MAVGETLTGAPGKAACDLGIIFFFFNNCVYFSTLLDHILSHCFLSSGAKGIVSSDIYVMVPVPNTRNKE